MIVAVLCVMVMGICIPLVVLRPQWVFYTFLVMKVFEAIFGSYIAGAGNLGMPRTWVPGDFLFLLTLAATIFVHKDVHYPAEGIKKCLIILSLLCFLSLVQGIFLYSRTALTYSRMVHFVAAFVFSVRYFTNEERVRGFLRFFTLLMALMFVIHILIRFELYTPPSAEIEFVSELGGERGVQSLVPQLYIVLAGIAISRIINKAGSVILSVVFLSISAFGIVLTETRSTYGALAVMVFCALIFMKRRVKMVVLYGITGMLLAFILGNFQYDFFQRFKRVYEDTGFKAGTIYAGDPARAAEYRVLAGSYRNAPIMILTGRGIGAMHEAVAGRSEFVGYYHCEYLGWLDRSGLLGLGAVLFLFVICIYRGYLLSQLDLAGLKHIGTMGFLIFAAIMAEGFFHAIFSHMQGASIYICFASILANWKYLYGEGEIAQDELWGYPCAEEVGGFEEGCLPTAENR